MAPFVSWKEMKLSPVVTLPSTPSVVPIESLLSTPYAKSPSIPESSRARTTSGTQPPSFLGVDVDESETRDGSRQGSEGSFSQHGKYFFKDGNVQFLVSRVTCYMAYAPNVLTIPRSMATSTVFTVTFSLAILCISPLDLPSLGSVITRLHRPLYPWEMSKTGTSKPFSLFCILSEFSIPLSCFLFIEVYTPARNFEEHDLSYEQWRSVLHLSTRWGFDSLRRLALRSIHPPTACDRLLLARKYSVDHWIVPALTALCERTSPISLNEARGMSVEDVVLVATVREHIRSKAIQFGVNSTEISRRVEAMQAGTLGPATDDEIPPEVPPEIEAAFAVPDSQVPPPPTDVYDGFYPGKQKVRKKGYY